MVHKLIEKYKGMNRLAKVSAWFMLASCFQKGVSFIVIPIFTRLLSIEEYGKYSLFLSWSNVLLIIVTLNIVNAGVDKGLMKYQKDRDRFVSAVQGLCISVTTFFAVIVFFQRKFLSDITGLDSWEFLPMFMYFFSYSPLTLWIVRERFEMRYRALFAVSILQVLLTPIISFFLIGLQGPYAASLIWGYVSAEAFFGVIFLLLQFFKGRVFLDWKYWKFSILFCLPLILDGLSIYILNQSDRIMIGRICGNSDAAIYALANNVAMGINIVLSAMNTTLIPYTYQKMAEGDVGAIKKHVSEISAGLLLLALVIMVFTPEIIRVMGTDEYKSGIWVVPSLLVGNYAFFLTGRLTNIEYHYEKARATMLISIVCAAINIILNAIFIPRFGFMAAGYTTLASYILQMMMHMLYVISLCNRKREPIPYDMKLFLVLTFILLLTSIITMSLYRFNLIRLMIVALVGMGAFIWKRYCDRRKGNEK